MYTNNCRRSYGDRHIIKYADDSTIGSLLQEQGWGDCPVDYFVIWCSKFHLQLNMKKTESMLIDFGEIIIKSSVDEYKWSGYEMTDNHKYLGIITDDKLSFEASVSVICKKILQIIFSFNVCNKMLTLFYKYFIKPGFSLCIVFWFGNFTLSNRNRLISLVKVARKCIGISQNQPIAINCRPRHQGADLEYLVEKLNVLRVSLFVGLINSS